MRFKIIAALLILVVALLSLVAILLVLKWNPTKNGSGSQKASISGTFNVNGVIPAGASITVLQKKLGTKGAKSTIFASNLPVSDLSPWSFNNASVNNSYEVQGEIVVNGKIVSVSDPIVVTAPADDETLTFDLESDDNKPNAIISGNIAVSGYIPSGSTITVKGRKIGASTFTTVASGLTGQINQFMSYTTALSGITYEVQAVLLSSSGATIGTSPTLVVTAPAVNEKLTINSSATPPATPTPTSAPANNNNAATPTPAPSSGATISGGINLNGAAPTNGRIVIFQQTTASPTYQVAVNNVTPVDGATWSWNSAQNGGWYTLIAVLKQHNSDGTDTDIATSTPVTVAAPSSNIIFTLNSNVSLSAPGGPISVNCQTYNGGPNQNNWNVVITFQSVPGAQTFWYQVGNNSGGNNVVNTATQSNTTSTTFNNNTTYYARYAYANVPSTPLGSPQWSSFSSSTPLQCSH